MAIVDELVALLGYEIEGEELVQRYQNSLDQVNSRVTKFAENAARAATIATGLFATGMSFLGRSVVDTSAQFEVYQATLETIKGSADRARASLDWITEFGAKTPYGVAQVTEAFVALKAYGIDPIADDALRVLGDTASAMNKPLSQAVEAFADAATGEFERLKEFGIRASQEGDNVTFRWTKNGEELTRTVRKNSNDIRAFLLETMGDRFNGAMLRQSTTWTGMMSNLGDTWMLFKKRIGDAGLFDTVKEKLAQVLDKLGELNDDGTLDVWAQRLSDAFTWAVNVVTFVVERFAANIAFLAENFESIQGPLIFFGSLFAWLIARAFPLLTIISVLAFAIDDLLAYMQGGESVIGDFIQKIQDLTGISEGAAEAIAGLSGAVIAGLVSAFILAPVRTLRLFGRLLVFSITSVGPLLLRAGIGLAGFVVSGLYSAFILAPLRLLKGFGRILVLAVTTAGPMLLRAILGLGTLIRVGFVALAPLVLKAAMAAFALLSNPIGWAILLAGAAAGLIYYFWDEIKAAWEATKETAIETFNSLKDWILDIDWLGVGTGIMNSIWDGMKALGQQIQDWFLSIIPDWAREFIVGDQQQFDEEAFEAEARASMENPNPSGLSEDRQREVLIAQRERLQALGVPEDKLPVIPSSTPLNNGMTPLTRTEFDTSQAAAIQEYLAGVENLEGNLAKMVPENAVEATVTDSRQDNRQFPVTTSIEINQEITESRAPSAAAEATGAAVAASVTQNRTQMEAEPSF